MNRLGSLFWLMLVICTGAAMFTVKYAVATLDDELAKLRKQTVAEQLELRVLNAEWTYLTQPDRLAELNRQFLGLAPMTIKQLQHTIAELPMRPPPAAAPVVAQAAPAIPELLPSSSGDVPGATPAVLRAAVEPATARPAAARAERTLDELFAQIAGDR